MTTYDTGNPVPSGDARDRFDNTQTLDELINSPLETTRSRLGVDLKTWAGIQQQVTAYLIAQGYEAVYLVYGAGVIVERQTQLVQRSGELYRVMNASEIPLTLTGTWTTDAPKLQAVGDAALRAALASSGGTALVNSPRGTLEQDLLDLADKDVSLSQSLWQTAQNAGQIGDLTAVEAAVARGTVRIAVVGDSILEGVSQILYQDSAIGIWMRLLLEQNPGLKVIVSNYSIPGQSLGNLADPNFKGVDFGEPGGFWMPPSGPVENRWPGGSGLGVSWWNHIRDSAPDLVVFGFGMNHVAGGSPPLDYNFNVRFDAIYYKALTTEAAAWAVAPSFALVSSMLPTNDPGPDGGVWPHFRKQVQDSAAVVRGICAEMNWTCIDVNRWWVFQGDAIDVGSMTYRRNPGIGEYPAGWTTTSGSFNVIGADAISGIGSITNNVKCTDLYARAHFQLGSAPQNGGFFYRDYGDIIDNQHNRYEATVLESGGNWYLNVYWRGSPGENLGSVLLNTISGRDFLLDVHVEGCHHRFYVDGVLVLDRWHYGNVGAGSHGLVISGGSSPAYVSSTIFRQGNAPKLGDPHYSEEDLLGLGQAEWASNPDSLGGGKLNHPSKLGVKLAYVPAFMPLAREIRKFSSQAALTGSNANGSFIKTPDGRMKAVNMISSYTVSIAAGATHLSDVFPFPAAFKSTPAKFYSGYVTNAAGGALGLAITAGAQGINGWQFVIYNPSAYAVTRVVELTMTAEGDW